MALALFLCGWLAACRTPAAETTSPATAVPPQGTSAALRAASAAGSSSVQLFLAEDRPYTEDPTEFLQYEPTGLGIRLMHPPEMEAVQGNGEAGVFRLLAGGELALDAVSGSQEGTRFTLLTTAVATFADVPHIDLADPVSILELVILPGYEIAEIVQAPAAVTINGLPGATVRIHQRPFAGSDTIRRKYLAVILDGERVLLLNAETAVADEASFVPVAQEIINSLELQRGPIP